MTNEPMDTSDKKYPELHIRVALITHELLAVVYPHMKRCDELAKTAPFFNCMLKHNLTECVLSAIASFIGSATNNIIHYEYKALPHGKLTCIRAIDNAHTVCTRRIEQATMDPNISLPAFAELRNCINEIQTANVMFHHRLVVLLIEPPQL